MAPTTSGCKSATKPAPRRKSARRKANAARPLEGPMGNENDPTVANNDNCNSLLLSREELDDVHEQNWWAINVEKAATLIQRCMKKFGWDRAEAKRIFDAYRQFLILKKEHEDWDQTKLIPAWPVFFMWDQHTRMSDYSTDMRDLLGHVVSCSFCTFAGDKVGQMEDAAKEALKERFGPYDEELWDNISIGVQGQERFVRRFRINRREPLSGVMGAYCDMLLADDVEGSEDIKKLQFTLNGRAISGDDTCLRLGLEDGAEIQVNNPDKVMITIRYSSGNEHLVVLVDKTTMLSKAFEECDLDFRGERKKYVFLYKQRKIYGFESPIALDMKSRGNVIEVVPREAHENKSCVCCNPMAFEEQTKENADAPEDTSDDSSVDY